MSDKLSKNKHEKQLTGGPAPFYGGATHRGAIGKANEDRYEFFRVGLGDANDWHAAPNSSIYVAAVADGVTSKAAGAEASTLAIEAVGQALQDATVEQPAMPANISALLEVAFQRANLAIRQAVTHNPALSGMSTTLVLAAIADNRLYIAHLGDSRAYLIRNRSVYCLTLDHTGVQKALDSGVLTVEQARTHPNRHLILRHLSAEPITTIDHQIILPGTNAGPEERQMVSHIDLMDDDVIMLCSDGATDRVSELDIAQTMTTYRHYPEKASRRLVKNALDLEEPDNITVVAITIRNSPFALTTMRRAATGLSSATRVWMALAVLLLLLGVGVSWTASTGWAKWPNFTAVSIISSQPLEPQPPETSSQPVMAATERSVETVLPSATEQDEPAIKPAESAVVRPVVTAAPKTVGTAIAKSATASTSVPASSPRSNLESQPSVQPAIPTPTRQKSATLIPPTSTSIPASGLRPAPTSLPTLIPTVAANQLAVAVVTAAPTIAQTNATNRPVVTQSIPNATYGSNTTVGSVGNPLIAPAPAQPIPTLQPTAANSPTPLFVAAAIDSSLQAASVQTVESTQTSVEAEWDIVLLSPIEESLKKRQRFQWQANFTLPASHLFELLIWPAGGSPLRAGFSPSGASTKTDLSINLDKFADQNSKLLKPGERYRWGVGLVETNDTSNRILVFDAQHEFTFRPGGSDNSGKSKTSSGSSNATSGE